jgi:hypothetical protein
MTEIVVLLVAKSRVFIFTCECDLTPIAEQPILVTQKKTPPVPYGPTLTAARSVLCAVKFSRSPWVTYLVMSEFDGQIKWEEFWLGNLST